jgi:NAD(P)-dependent dehydrogenase (short-subunit alcohol dehydrogenase family)
MAIALVTGASRGVGHGAAVGLSAAGFTVESADLPPDIVRIRCDHTDEANTAHVFDRIAATGEPLIYGIAKAATDKMSSDMAVEFREHGIAVMSLYPGLVRTEAVLAAAQNGWLDISNSESPEFIGRVVAALSADRDLIRRSGSVLVAAQVARDLGVADIDGTQPRPLTLATS